MNKLPDLSTNKLSMGGRFTAIISLIACFALPYFVLYFAGVNGVVLFIVISMMVGIPLALYLKYKNSKSISMSKPTQTSKEWFCSICSNCGKKLTEDVKFCPSCGTRILKEEIQDTISVENPIKQQPQSKAHQNAVGVVYFIGILNLGLSLALILTQNEFLRQMGVGLYTFIFGLAFLVLGFLVQRRSYFALSLAIIIYILDSIVGVVLSLLASLTPGNSYGFAWIFAAIPIRLGFLSMMIRGIGGIKALNRFYKSKRYNRLNKLHFRIGLLISVVISVLINLYANFIYNPQKVNNGVPNFTFLDWFLVAVFFLAIFFMFSICRRRFHDFGQSGWRILLLLIPIVNIFIGLKLLFKDGNTDENIYGKPQGSEIDYRAMVGVLKPKIIFLTITIFVIVLIKVVPISENTGERISNTINRMIPTSTDSINMGVYNGRKYTNNSFGISFTIPENIYIGSNETVSGLFKTNSAYFDDQPGKELLQQLKNEKAIIFTFASTQRTGPSSNFSFGADKAPMQSIFQTRIPSSEEYVKDYKSQVVSADPTYSFSEITSQTIDGVEFSVIHAKKPPLIEQDVYVTQRNGYYISFINSYNSNSDKNILNSIISSIKFDETPVIEDWSISNFQSNISIQKSGQVNITETIAVDFKNLSKHGITRDLPNVYQLSGKKIYSDISINQVKLNNIETKYQTSKSDKYLTIQIGDANKTISGKNTFQIEYVVSGGILKNLTDNDQFYWNITGNNWTVPITNVEATLTLPEDGIVKSDCFNGLTGSTSSCSISSDSSHSVSFIINKNKNPGGMAILVDYRKGMIPISN